MVTVPFEGEEAFPAARKVKEDKYDYLMPLLRAKGFRKVEVDGFVVGALGSWDPDNEAISETQFPYDLLTSEITKAMHARTYT